MIEVTEVEFEQFVEEAVAGIPERFASHLNNVAFIAAEEPSREQRHEHGKRHGRALLLGLYEGVPLPLRDNGYSGVVPDVITVFKRAHELTAHSREELRGNVHQTVWHEVAHYFGLDHGQIRALEK